MIQISAKLARQLNIDPALIPDDVPVPKYRNQAVNDPIRGIFDSKLEYNRFLMLEAGVKVGAIRNLKRQVGFKIEVEGGSICEYVADFTYETCLPSPGLHPVDWRSARQYNWYQVIEDAKGHRTRIYRLKKKLMKAVLGLDIFEWPPKKRKELKPRHRIGGKIGNATIKAV